MGKTTKESENKHLTKMLETKNKAIADGQKSVIVFTTKRKHYKTNKSSPYSFSSENLKSKFYEAYKYFLCQHDVTTRLLNPNELSVEWVVKLR